MAAAPQAPAWLAARFPLKQAWRSLRSCRLRVDEEVGAGLELEETDFGYRVDGLAPKPGQDEALQQGDLIISIEGERLWGLEGDALGEAFGARFQPGAEILFVREDEAKEAVIEQESNDECPCEEPADPAEAASIRAAVEASGNYELLRREKSSTEYPAVVRIPVSRTTVWSLDAAAKESLDTDLAHLGNKFGLSATAECDKFGNMQKVVLSGVSSAIAAARAEVVQILDFYRRGQWSADATVEAKGDWEGGGADGPTKFAVPDHIKDLHQFKYHDHTADIIVHAWGKTQAEAFSEVVVGMFNYMTPLENVNMECAVEVEATGHDLLDLLYHLLDEFLFVFSTEMHVSRCVEILDFDTSAFKLRARGYGEKMKLSKHEQGTEIKAITMHMMKILGPETVLTENGTVPRVDPDETEEGAPHEVYVLLDI